MTFDNVLTKYRDLSFSKRDTGTRFERLMRVYLLTDPKYSFKQVYLWEDFFAREELGETDTGIDLVAETYDNEFWAIQCKCYSPSQYIDKPDVDTFISTSGRIFNNKNNEKSAFSFRMWISTTDKWTQNAENALMGQSIPVTRINISDLQSAPVDWGKLEDGVHGEAARVEKHGLRPHQQSAVQAASKWFSKKDKPTRGKLIMACGTGKTFTSLKIAERESNGFTLVLVPSIALIGQILREWTAHSEKPLNTICVCSDPKVTQSRKKSSLDVGSFSTIDLTVPATTDPTKILEQFRKFKNDNMTVIFSTYQSIEAIEKAQNQGLPEFGLIVCDEAHRTTGVTIAADVGINESAFVRVHDNNLVKAVKRLYMTATPRLYNEESKTKARKNEAVLCSMDDPTIYGEEIYRMGFGEAVEKGLLADYKVLIFTVSDKDVPASFQESIAGAKGEVPADTIAKIIGCINALSKQVWGEGSESLKTSDPAPMSRAVAFCQNIEISKEITGLFNSYEERSENLVATQSKHIDGSMNAPRREELLNWLKAEEDERQCKILTNVRCLSEGVDVPALDAVMFLSARNSQVDVVQSVGRVMRRSHDKKYGYIIIPVMIPSNVEPDKALDDNERFKVVWSVLNALRAHDDRFNATVNKIELNKKRPDNILVGGIAPFGDDDPTGSIKEQFTQMSIGNFQELQNVIFARLVQKVGDRRYWEEWAQSVAQIAERQTEQITNAVQDPETKKTFEMFLQEMKTSIDASITADRAIEMLAQHIITAPVFDALFDKYAFAKHNAVSKAMDFMLNELRQKGELTRDTEELQSFYDNVRKRAKGIDNAEGRQSVIIELYNTFFKTAFPKMTQMLGIVYTPVEVVDFIIHSVNDVLEAEFGRKLTDENVNILDPFTGTGTFITRLIQSGLINKADLPRKYEQEFFANELLLLAYYIASVNIESSYHDALNMETYQSFEGIALTDTFQAWEENKPQQILLDQNSDRVRRQNTAPISVIFGNPPYSVGQKSANDDAKNNNYPQLDESIEKTYAELSNAGLKKSLYDSYIRAFRYSADRLRDGDGIICFVSNGAWLDGSSTDGFRKALEQEFSKIYVFNLRGNQRTSGELSRKEGGKIFGSGSRTPVTITLLVKRSGFEGKAEILYRDIGDYLKREEKLTILANTKTFLNPGIGFTRLSPNEHGDWITTRNHVFQTFTPLASEKKYNEKSETFFVVNSFGYGTNRDTWVYNFSKDALLKNMEKTIKYYNSQIDNRDSNVDLNQISWTRGLLNNLKAGNEILFDATQVTPAAYRPFTKQFLYFGEKIIEMRGQLDSFFPTPDTKNLLICVSGIGVTKDFSTLISDGLTDLEFIGKSQCFPLYYYEEAEAKTKKDALAYQIDLFGEAAETEYIRKDGISNFILRQSRGIYGNTVTKEDIFYYVYGFLHSPAYRTTFADDLKKSLPRIPLVESPVDFWAFSKAGRELAKLHLNYESVPPLPEVTVSGSLDNLHMEKMRFFSKDRKDTILYNSQITVKNIPQKAYEYIVNGRSAIEWIMERCQIKTDKISGITNDPNQYKNNKPSYILDLLLSIIAVSVKTMEIVEKLPDYNTSK